MWKEIEGYEGRYSVSEDGQVFSHRRKKVLKGMISSRGYYSVNLCNGKSHFTKVSRLVGKAFVENPCNYPQINHKDGNKLNDHYSNLEWCTQAQNIRHGLKMGLYKTGELHFNAKLSREQVADIREQSALGVTYRELSNKHGVAFETISGVVRRLQRTYE